MRRAIVATMLLMAACAPATYDTHDDLTISTQVKIALIDDARLGGFRINAATSHGTVTLQGTVPTQADVDRAVAIARRVRGVKDVKSELKVARSQLPDPSSPRPVSGFQ
jgi:osmotically-inducible protein OsmY